MSRVGAGALAGRGLMVALGATLGPAPGPGSEPGASLVVRIPDAIAMLVVGLLALSFVLFLSLQRRRPPPGAPPPARAGPAPPPGPPPPPRRAAMVALPFLLLLAAIACFTWARWTP